MTDLDEVIRATEEVTSILESRGVGALVIGAVAWQHTAMCDLPRFLISA
jgi:hypothetical protein